MKNSSDIMERAEEEKHLTQTGNGTMNTVLQNKNSTKDEMAVENKAAS